MLGLHGLHSIPGDAQSKAWVCGPSLAEIMSLNPAGRKDVSFAGVVFCQVEVSTTGRSLLQNSPNECNVSECDLQTSRIRRSRPTRSVDP
jgi:hypothetical protein